MADGYSKLLTEVDRDAVRPARRVRWIDWDSGFRASGLKVGDRVVGDGGTPYDETAVERGLTLGGPGEGSRLTTLGLAAGDRLAVEVERDGASVTLAGTLVENRSHRDAQGRRSFGDDGPAQSEKDGFEYAWAPWYEQFKDVAATVLAGWDYTVSFDSRRYAERLEVFAERVAFLERSYPGAFARAAREDLEAGRAILAGEPRTLGEEDLEYRRLGEIRAARVTAAADAAWEAFRAGLGDGLLAQPFPVPNPFDEDVSGFVGKTVVLPEVGDRDLLYETGRSWYRAGSAQGSYLLDRHGTAIRGLFAATDRYVEKVDPFLDKRRIVFVGVVEPEPALVVDVVRNVSLVGLKVRPTAALVTVGDGANRYFVDLRHPEGVDPGTPAPDAETFAGESGLLGVHRPRLDDDLDPAGVMEVFFTCLKVGDVETWKRCFADWKVRQWYMRDENGVEVGHPWVDRAWTTLNDRDAMAVWDQSRKALMEEVYDLEVARVAPPRTVYVAGEQPAELRDGGLGPQTVEEAAVLVAHVGRFDDGFRTFAGGQRRRKWTLQRLDDGPWRITSAQSI